MTEGKRSIIQQLLQEYDIQSAEDIQEALKDLLGGTIKEMMEAEMDEHLGYQKSQRSDSDDYRNGYKSKRVNSSYGTMDIQVPQDRKSTFEPQVVRKRQKDISLWNAFVNAHEEDFSDLRQRYASHPLFSENESELNIALYGCYPLHRQCEPFSVNSYQV